MHLLRNRCIHHRTLTSGIQKKAQIPVIETNRDYDRVVYHPDVQSLLSSSPGN